MTTDWNLWKTGLMAIDGSMQLRGAETQYKHHNRHSATSSGARGHFIWAEFRVQVERVLHLKCSTGLAMVGVLSSKGSMMMVKPSNSKRNVLK